MSGFQVKTVGVLMETLWWLGLAGLVYDTFCGNYSFQVMCCMAMMLCLRWQAGCNTGSIKAITGFLDRLDVERFLSDLKKRMEK